MAKRSKYMDDGSDSDDSDDGDDQDDHWDPDDPDESEFRPHNQRGKKRTREDAIEQATYGDWAADSGDRRASAPRGRGRGRGGAAARTDYTRGQSFVSAGSSSTAAPTPLDNLSTTLPIAPGQAQEDGDDEPMDLDSDVDSNPTDDDDDMVPDEPQEDDLAPVPGLAPSPPPPAAPEEPSPFAPRGIGSSRGGRGGLGSSRGGLGMGMRGLGGRPGLGGAGASSSHAGAPTFASATSASAMPLGGAGSSSQEAHQPGDESPMSGAATPRTGLGARAGIGGGGGIGSRAGIGGGGGGGIGSAHRPSQSLVDSLREQLAAESAAYSPSPAGTPTSTPGSPAAEPRARQSFLPTPATSATKAPGKISKKEQQHFAQLASSGSLGLKMLEKMGWKNGTGLGANEQGIVTPIGEGQKLRKKGAGIASGERSAGAIAEAARMRGEDPDAIDDEKKTKRGPKAATPKVVKDAWQQPKRPPKTKTSYKTYEEIVAESGGAPEGVGMLVDLSGNALPSQSLSSLPAFGAGSADPTQLPELRHNLTLLTSTISSDIASLAREGKGVDERRSHLTREETRVRTAVEKQERGIARLEAIVAVVERVRGLEKDAVTLLMAGGGDSLGPAVLFAPFRDDFDELLGNFSDEYESMRLDEVVVGAIAPIVRRLFQDWDPLAEPTFAVRELKAWRRHFLIDKDVIEMDDGRDVDLYGDSSRSNGASSKRPSGRSMTAYESLMWTIWLPRVRSAINNVWSPSDPAPAVALFTSWAPLLPIFLRDNILDQLILPKVSKAIADWSPGSVRRGGASLHTIVFLWLEHAGQRMEQILDEAKRKVRAWLKGWKGSDGVPVGLGVWRDAFPTADWDTLMLKHVLPQLGNTLRDSFEVNPRQQDLAPLEAVLAWKPLLRSSMISQLIEGGFFPKWLDALYVWLTSDPNLEQVAEWYSYWKSYFDDDVLALSGVSRGFRKGLDLMNQAMALGDDAKYRQVPSFPFLPVFHSLTSSLYLPSLKRPDTRPSGTSSSSKSSSHNAAKSSASAASAQVEVSFRSVVEEVAAASNLVFLATGKAHARGYALFRVSQTVDGKSGVTVYLDDDVVWLQEGTGWKPVGVEEMVKRALAK